MGTEESSDDFAFNIETIMECNRMRAVAREASPESSLDLTTISACIYSDYNTQDFVRSTTDMLQTYI